MRCAALFLSSMVLCACEPAETGSRVGSVEPGTVLSGTPSEPGFVPHAFGVGRVQFGYDAQRAVAMPAQGWDASAEVMLPISLEVLILDQSALTDGFVDGVNGCTVTLQRFDELPLSSWAEEAGAWFAFEVAESTGSHTCGALDFPSDWGSNPAGHVIKWSWGAGLQPVTQDAIDIMGEDWPAWEPWVIGGGYWWQELSVFTGGTEKGGTFDPDGYVDAGIAQAFQVDAAGTLVVDGKGQPVQLMAAELAGALPTAWYEVQVVRYLTPARRLLESPY